MAEAFTQSVIIYRFAGVKGGGRYWGRWHGFSWNRGRTSRCLKAIKGDHGKLTTNEEGGRMGIMRILQSLMGDTWHNQTPPNPTPLAINNDRSLIRTGLGYATYFLTCNSSIERNTSPLSTAKCIVRIQSNFVFSFLFKICKALGAT